MLAFLREHTDLYDISSDTDTAATLEARLIAAFRTLPVRDLPAEAREREAAEAAAAEAAAAAAAAEAQAEAEREAKARADAEAVRKANEEVQRAIQENAAADAAAAVKAPPVSAANAGIRLKAADWQHCLCT